MTETIMAVKSSVVDNIEDGFHRMHSHSIRQVISPKNIYFGPKEQLEHDESFRQLVVYILIVNKSEVVCYRRTRQGGENRLHNQLSLGIGGHVNMTDVRTDANTIDVCYTLYNAYLRERNEELAGYFEWAKIIGLLKCSETAVNRVHLGIVYLVHTDNLPLVIDIAISDLKMVPFTEVAQLENLENWSQLLVPYIQSL